MNLPNKLTMFRIFLTFIIILILLFPFSAMGIEIPQIFVNESKLSNFSEAPQL